MTVRGTLKGEIYSLGSALKELVLENKRELAYLALYGTGVYIGSHLIAEHYRSIYDSFISRGPHNVSPNPQLDQFYKFMRDIRIPQLRDIARLVSVPIYAGVRYIWKKRKQE